MFAVSLASLSACGGGGSGNEPEPPLPCKDGSQPPCKKEVLDVTSIVEKATVRIVAGTGIAADSSGTQRFVTGSGSGFIINEEGYAITNNHVINAGAASTIEVYLEGESRSRAARVLAYSECSDLALIDIAGNDGFSPLEWYKGSINNSLPVLSVGFPLGDSEVTWKKGIISKKEANGESSWSYLDAVIEHDAEIIQGNSGGPLVENESGHVVGVNYAGDPSGEDFAIPRDEVLSFIDEVNSKLDPSINKKIRINSIGIVGQATTAGISVLAVDPSSPAGDAEIEAGDLIVSLMNEPLNNASMKRYCTILKNQGDAAVMGIDVQRDGVLYKGKLNKDGGELVAEPGGSGGNPTISIGESISGSLNSSDQTFDDGSYYDIYIEFAQKVSTLSFDTDHPVAGCCVPADNGAAVSPPRAIVASGLLQGLFYTGQKRSPTEPAGSSPGRCC